MAKTTPTSLATSYVAHTATGLQKDPMRARYLWGVWGVGGSEQRGSHLWTHREFGGFPSVPGGKEPTCQYRRPERHRFDPWDGKIPWRRKWQPAPVFLPGESHGQRSLACYGPWGRKESDTTEQPSTHTHRDCMFVSSP